jgi:hypothetical protein
MSLKTIVGTIVRRRRRCSDDLPAHHGKRERRDDDPAGVTSRPAADLLGSTIEGRLISSIQPPLVI